MKRKTLREARIEKATKALLEGGYDECCECGCDPETDIVDLMTDLLHLGVAKGCDVERIRRCVENHFESEKDTDEPLLCAECAEEPCECEKPARSVIEQMQDQYIQDKARGDQ